MIEEKVMQYIEELTNEKIEDMTLNLFEAGYLTSLHVLDLITFIESHFEVEIPVEEVGMDSFGSVSGIVGLVKKIKAA